MIIKRRLPGEKGERCCLGRLHAQPAEQALFRKPLLRFPARSPTLKLGSSLRVFQNTRESELVTARQELLWFP